MKYSIVREKPFSSLSTHMRHDPADIVYAIWDVYQHLKVHSLVTPLTKWPILQYSQLYIYLVFVKSYFPVG